MDTQNEEEYITPPTKRQRLEPTINNEAPPYSSLVELLPYEVILNILCFLEFNEVVRYEMIIKNALCGLSMTLQDGWVLTPFKQANK